MAAEEAKEGATPAVSEEAAKAILLVSGMSRHVDNIEWVKIILDGLKVQYTELNCDLPENRDERSRLWGISGKRAVYPQLFLGDEFIGDREDLEDQHDEGALKDRLASVIKT